MLGSDVWTMEMGTADSQYWLVHQPQLRPSEEFKCNPRQFWAGPESNLDYEFEICPRHQILAWWGDYASVKPFKKLTPGVKALGTVGN